LTTERGTVLRLNRYAEVVRWMTWPRRKNSRSSALPVTREHNGVHIIVTPAPDSERARGHGHGQNTGISGTRHAVASTEPTDDEAIGPEPVVLGPPDCDDEEERRGAGIEILGVATDDVPAEQPDQDPPDQDPPEGAVSELPHLNEPVAGTPQQPTSEDAGSNHRSFGGFWRAGNGATGADGDQPQRTRVRDLALDARVRLWRLRAMIMLAVGVVFSTIAGWPTGITLAILAGIADTIYRSRTVGSVPSPGKLDRAQRSTQKQLARMHRAGYLAWHARPIPGSMEVIDHLVIGPTGVYAIDSEKWDKKLPIRTRNGKQLWYGPESKKERLEHARWEAGQASERLSAALGRDIRVRPAMAVYGPSIPWDIATIREVDVFSGDRLRKYLRRRARIKGVPQLSPDEVREIYEAAGKVMPLAPTRTATPVG
jgi:hypothetical protein